MSFTDWHDTMPTPWRFEWYRSEKGTWLLRIKTMKTAIIIVDVQNDFVPGGALAVADGKKIIPHIAKVLEQMKNRALVITTQDWHPLDHNQFDTNGGKWPVHCVANSAGAELVKEVCDALPDDAIAITKGEDPKQDGYSAFDGAEYNSGLSLDLLLTQYDIEHIYVCGIATDYCVKATVLDAIKHGYRVTLLEDCIAGVDLQTTTEALIEMAQAHVQFMSVPESDTATA